MKKVLIIDFSQIVYVSNYRLTTSGEDDFEKEDVLRPILFSIKKLKSKFPNVDEVIIACDSEHSWRRDLYPTYKASRRKSRDKMLFNWDKFYHYLKEIIKEMEECYPAKVVKVDKAEGDDVISTITKKLVKEDCSVIIASSDKDMIQLRKYSKNIEQYCPKKGCYLNDNEEFTLNYHILKGDSSDGVPNFLTDDDVYIDDNKKSKVLSKKALTNALEALSKSEEELFKLYEDDNRIKHNYIRNKTLIDFNSIPETIQKNIVSAYENASNNGMRYRKWLIENKCIDVLA